ncbi:MAG: hypothetical protein WAO74_08950 [Polaribacter sp.]|uniref:hypothetical protein n=1 Tax=Polaribacter sp. TaxID=1920175 RepID=UPI003BAECEB6
MKDNNDKLKDNKDKLNDNSEKLYDTSKEAQNLKEHEEQLEGGSEHEDGTKTIHTSETRILEGTHREVLIGKNLEEIEKLKEKQKSIEKTILDKLTR